MPENNIAHDKQRSCFMVTINNPLEKNYSHEQIAEIVHKKFKNMVFWCMADEIATTGTLHTHIFIMLKRKKRWSAVRNAFPQCHIEEEIRTTPRDVVNYIKKSGKNTSAQKKETQIAGTYFEEGIMPEYAPSDSKSEMLGQIQEMLDSGMTPEAIMQQHIMYRQYETLIKKAFFKKRYEETPVMRDVKFYYHIGESGTGKSYAFVKLSEMYADDVFIGTDYANRCSSLMDGYYGEKIVFLDEVKPDSIPYGMLLNMTDKYRIQLHSRYSNVFTLYTELHLTSVFPPEELYHGMVDSNRATDSYNQLLRRITSVIYHYKIGDEYCTYEMRGSEYKTYDDLKQKALYGYNGFHPLDEKEQEELPFD